MIDEYLILLGWKEMDSICQLRHVFMILLRVQEFTANAHYNVVLYLIMLKRIQQI